MSQIYPHTLPDASSISLLQKPVSRVVRTEMDSGRLRARKASNVKSQYEYEINWQYTGEQYALFKSWFEKSLKAGSDSFWMKVWRDNAYVYQEVRFKEAYEAQVNPKKQNYWDVKAVFVLQNNFVDESQTPPYSVSVEIDWTFANDPSGVTSYDLVTPGVYPSAVTIIIVEQFDGTGNIELDAGRSYSSGTAYLDGFPLHAAYAVEGYSTRIESGDTYAGVSLGVVNPLAPPNYLSSEITHVNVDGTKGKAIVILEWPS